MAVYRHAVKSDIPAKLLLELFIGHWAIICSLDFIIISPFKVLIFTKDTRDLIFKMKTKEALLTCKLGFEDRDILYLVCNYNIAYAKWYKDNNMPPSYNIVCLCNKL